MWEVEMDATGVGIPLARKGRARELTVVIVVLELFAAAFLALGFWQQQVAASSPIDRSTPAPVTTAAPAAPAHSGAGAGDDRSDLQLAQG
jgi:hypothetical protein